MNKYLYTIPVVLAGLYFYTNYNNHLNKNENEYNFNLVKEFILNQEEHSILGKKNKPIIWIHVPYKINSRNWESFGSRNTSNLNAPYLYLTLKTIIEQCTNDFHICLIDDLSFEKLLPNWNIKMDQITSPLIDYARTLGTLELLYNYGGINMPISFLCINNLKNLWYEKTEKNKPFIFENINDNSSSKTLPFFPSTFFMGCKKNCNVIKNSILHVQNLMANDHTQETEFKGYINKWFYEKYNRGDINLLCGSKIGIKNKDNEPILIDDLLNFSNIKFYDDIYGIYVNHEHLLKRTNYQWFAKLTPNEAINANTILSLYFQKYLPI